MKIKNINVHFTEAEIDKKIRELGARISEDYAGESVCLICILKGASFFTCELAKDHRSGRSGIYVCFKLWLRYGIQRNRKDRAGFINQH